MQSGSIVNLGDVSCGQPCDALVTETGCSGANDTLQCSREVPYETWLKAEDRFPELFPYQVCIQMHDKMLADA